MTAWKLALAIVVIAATTSAATLTVPLVKPGSSDIVSAVDVTPEYARTLQRVLIAIPDSERDARTTHERVDPKFVSAVYDELLTAIPAYTEIGIIVRARDRDAVLEWTHLFNRRDDIHLHFVRGLENEIDLWTQDLGEYYEVAGDGRFLVSAVPHRKMTRAHAIAESRERVARVVFGKSMVVRADFVFEAGNLLFDKVDNRLRVLVGEDVVTRTINSAQLGGHLLTETLVAARISRQFGGAETVILRGQQEGGLIHLDQAFVLLKDRQVVLTSVPGPESPEQKVLTQYREQLEWLGYDVLELPTAVDDVRNYRASLNALPFTDLNTGENVVIFPVFPGEVLAEAQLALRAQDLVGKAAAAYELFERAGYAPVPIRDVAHTVGGNTHCIANIVY